MAAEIIAGRPPTIAMVTAMVKEANTVAATVLPTLSSLRQPEPRVIARLVAE